MEAAEISEELRGAGYPWFGLRVRSRSEQLAATALEGKGYRPFVPVYKVSRRFSDRTRQVAEPLFPGYVFCRFNPQRRLPVLTTPCVLGIVGVGKTPAPVETAEIDSILALVAAGLPATHWPFVRHGDRVRIVEGPLCGVEGIVTSRHETHRLILSVTLLQRSVSVEVQPGWVKRIG